VAKVRWGRFVPLVVLALGGGAGVYYVRRPVPVTVVAVTRGKAIDAVYATGTVEADARVVVKAKTSGSVEVLVREGARVKKGDLLARIDNPAVTSELRRGKAELSAASAQSGPGAPQLAALRASADALRADLELVVKELERTKKLVESGTLSSSEQDRLEARKRQLDGQLAANAAQQRAVAIDLTANRERASAAYDTLSSRVADTEVRSPQDGVVLTRAVEMGELVAPNQALFKLGDTSRLVIEVSVDEADIGRVRDGAGSEASRAAVSLYAFPKDVFAGRVYEVLPDADRARKSYVAKVRLDAPPAGLRSGMTAEVNIIIEEKDGVLLGPTEALVGEHVWVERAGKAAKVPVEAGIRDLLRFEIARGLEEGDRVIVAGQAGLTEGKRLVPTLRAPDKPPGGPAPASSPAAKPAGK
jgi:HlyD family secretion protein